MTYNLSEYINLLKENNLMKECSLKGDPEILNISYNSQEVTENTLFICKGSHFKEEYLLSAIEKGAVCYLAEEIHSVESDYILVNDLRKSIALLTNL